MAKVHFAAAAAAAAARTRCCCCAKIVRLRQACVARLIECTATAQDETTHHVPELLRAGCEPGERGHRILMLHASTEAAHMQYPEQLVVRDMFVLLNTSGSFPAACCPHACWARHTRAVSVVI
jgi:hypothetical protein